MLRVMAAGAGEGEGIGALTRHRHAPAVESMAMLASHLWRGAMSAAAVCLFWRGW